MLWRTHDHHRDVRGLASAPRTTAPHSTNRKKFAVTRHRLLQLPPAGPPLRPTLECAPSIVSNATKLSCAGNPYRHSHRSPRQFRQIASPPAATSAGRDCAKLGRNRNTHRSSPAGTRVRSSETFVRLAAPETLHESCPTASRSRCPLHHRATPETCRFAIGQAGQ